MADNEGEGVMTTLVSLQLVRSRIFPLQPLLLRTQSEARHTPAHAKQEEPEQEQAESATEKKDHSETKEHKEPK